MSVAARGGRHWVVLVLLGALAVGAVAWSRGTDRAVRATEARGTPTFPVGLYYAPVLRYQEVRRLGFNLVHLWALADGSTERALDEAARLGLKAVVELSDAWSQEEFDVERLARYVKAYRYHDALFAWYLVDEPKRSIRSLRAVGRAYGLVKALDPRHPVFIVVVSPERDDMFVPYLDVLGVDPYPVPDLPLVVVSRYLESARAVVGGLKPVWAVIQAHARPVSGLVPPRYPTPVELRNMVYQALVGRASGLMYFSFEWDGTTIDVQDPTLYRFLGAVNAEVNQLAEVLRSAVDVPTAGGADSNLRVRVLEHAGRTYVLAVNVAPRPARLQLPLGPGPPEATRLFEGSVLTLTGNHLADELDPHGVGVYVR